MTTLRSYGCKFNIDGVLGVHTWIITTRIFAHKAFIGLEGRNRYLFDLIKFHGSCTNKDDINLYPNVKYRIVYHNVRQTLTLSTKQDLKRHTLWFDTIVLKHVANDPDYRFACQLLHKDSEVTIYDYFFRPC